MIASGPSPTDTTIGLSWDRVICAAKYELYYEVLSAGVVTFTSHPVPTRDRTYEFDALTPETEHRIRLQAKYGGTASAWTSATATTLAPGSTTPVDPLALTASASPTTCETGGSVTVSWTPSGGSGSYNVTVDGQAVSGGSATVDCQTTAGTQMVVVMASDAGDAQSSATVSLTLTVTEPAPITARLRLAARYLTDGRGEFKLELDGDGEIEPSARFVLVSGMTQGAWVNSSAVSGEVGGRTISLGQISARAGRIGLPAGDRAGDALGRQHAGVAGQRRTIPVRHRSARRLALIRVARDHTDADERQFGTWRLRRGDAGRCRIGGESAGW